MTERFKAFMPFILKWECDYPEDKTGQLSNDPDDPGGATKWGIDKASHPLVDIPSLTLEGAMDIYSLEWEADKAEDLIPKLGEAYFNACVNCGVSRASTMLKGNLKASLYIGAQEAFYKRLVEAKPPLSKYLTGWLNRTSDLRRFLNV